MRTLLSLFRYLLTILIVVLPLQGSAAVIMSYGAGTAMARSMPGMASGDATSDAMSAMLAEGHCSHVAAPESKAKSAHMKCNASMNCCIGAVAPPSTLARLPTRFLSTEAQAAQEPAMTVFIPPTLERPPCRS